ncbi:MAG: hypothetical protein HP492_02325 [Nitrospira sp.]|nr:hypothetical protein [Nitrospira sp.]
MSRKLEMKRPWRGALAFAVPLTLCSLLGLFGCAIPHVPSRIVYEDPVNYVRLEEDRKVLPEWPQSHFSHPATVSKGVLRAILSGLKVQEHRVAPLRWIQGEAPLEPVFNDNEVTMLSSEMADALALAQYNERVTFYLSEPLTFARRTITSGGLYIQGTELHLLLGNWRIIYGIPTYGMIYDRRYPMRPTVAKGFDLFFEPADAVIPQQSSVLDNLLANSKDELVIDLSKVTTQERTPVSSPSSVF